MDDMKLLQRFEALAFRAIPIVKQGRFQECRLDVVDLVSRSNGPVLGRQNLCAE